MRKSYNRSISLRCVVCGSTEHFEYNDDKTYVKCMLCNREYLGGEDELIEMNEAMIADDHRRNRPTRLESQFSIRAN